MGASRLSATSQPTSSSNPFPLPRNRPGFFGAAPGEGATGGSFPAGMNENERNRRAAATAFENYLARRRGIR